MFDFVAPEAREGASPNQGRREHYAPVEALGLKAPDDDIDSCLRLHDKRVQLCLSMTSTRRSLVQPASSIPVASSAPRLVCDKKELFTPKDCK